MKAFILSALNVFFFQADSNNANQSYVYLSKTASCEVLREGLSVGSLKLDLGKLHGYKISRTLVPLASV